MLPLTHIVNPHKDDKHAPFEFEKTNANELKIQVILFSHRSWIALNNQSCRCNRLIYYPGETLEHQNESK